MLCFQQYSICSNYTDKNKSDSIFNIFVLFSKIIKSSNIFTQNRVLFSEKIYQNDVCLKHDIYICQWGKKRNLVWIKFSFYLN